MGERRQRQGWTGIDGREAVVQVYAADVAAAHLLPLGLAHARMLVRALSCDTKPALATDTVCCSITWSLLVEGRMSTAIQYMKCTVTVTHK